METQRECHVLFKITAIFGKTTQNAELLNLPKTQNSNFVFFCFFPKQYPDYLDYYLWLDKYQEQSNQTHTNIFQIVNSLLPIRMEKREGTDKSHMCPQTPQTANLMEWALLYS